MLRWKKRICLLRIGILLNLGYFLMILFLNEKIINFTWLLGIIYGLEEGFYFSVFNIFESEIKPSEIAKYQGTYTWINAIISMVIPIVFGSAMSVGGVKKAL